MQNVSVTPPVCWKMFNPEKHFTYPTSTMLGNSRLNLHGYLLCLISLLTWASPAAIAKLPPSSWLMQDGKSIQGKIRTIKNSQIEFLFSDGRRAIIPLQAFAPSTRNAVGDWARKQGGSLQFASWIKSPDSAFAKPWPKTVYGPANPQVINILKNSQPGIYRFESAHYHFISDAKLDIRTVQRFATLFETTYACNMALPINVPGKYHPKGHKFKIYLFGTYQNYIRNGGLPGTAGIYNPRNQSIFVPLIVLGVTRDNNTKKWMFQNAAANTVLSHEITHQLMNGISTAAWFTEGSAEYIANSKYTHAAFHLSDSKYKIFDYVKSRKASMKNIGRQLGPRVSLPRLETFMKMPYAQFSNKTQVNRNYGIALLLTYYFYHEDGAKNAANIKSYIKALQRGKSESAAQKALLNGRSYQQIEMAFRSFCSSQGLAIDFK